MFMKPLEDVTISLLINCDCTTITIHDQKSRTAICEIKLTPDQLSQALSRLGRVPCECMIGDLTKVGKVMQHKEFIFEMPNAYESTKSEIFNRCEEVLSSMNMSKWVPDRNLERQNTFTRRGGTVDVRVIIRRWV